jgi:hypothetical protein
LIRTFERAFWKQIRCATFSDMVSIFRIINRFFTQFALKFYFFELSVEVPIELNCGTLLNIWFSALRTLIFLKFVYACLAEYLITLTAVCRITDNHRADDTFKDWV